MGRSLTLVPAAAARAAIAAALAPPPAPPRALGAITLRAHQRTALAAVRDAIARFGGALLVDPVGSGKTFVALAAARDARDPLVVAPAVLRATWTAAARRAAVGIRFTSIESMSRGQRPPLGALVIVDEAHHFRRPGTRRYAALAAIAVAAPVLLVTATPVHNRAEDLRALLALFLGEVAAHLDPTTRRAVIVQAAAPGACPTPEIRPTRRLRLPADDDLLSAILALPGAGEAQPLVTMALIRAWASSDAALATALRRRACRTLARADALERGVVLDARELALWTLGDDAQQLALPGLVGSPASAGAAAGAAWAMRAHATACAALCARVRRSGALDARRARLLWGVVRRHHPAGVVAFSHAAETVGALWRHLRQRPGVCAVTAAGARIAGGRIPVREALARFAPVAHGVPPPPPAECIRLLLATDLASEGVNLQDAVAVVHLDLPWTVARLEQRVGRVARPGGPGAAVAVYAIAPPASATAALALEARLRTKWRAACAVRSPEAPLWPFDAPPDVPGANVAPALAALRERWAGNPRRGVAVVAAPRPVALAVVADGTAGAPRVVAWNGTTVADDSAALARAAVDLDGPDAVAPAAQVLPALRAFAADAAARATRRLTGLDPVLAARRPTWRRLDRALDGAPLHERARIAAGVTSARQLGARPRPIALEGEDATGHRPEPAPPPATRPRVLTALVGVATEVVDRR